MKFTIGEKIMVLRNRKGMSRKELGHKVYIVNGLKNLDFPDGRLKKIETGVISPEKFMPKEVETIAEVLQVPVTSITDDGESSSESQLFDSDKDSLRLDSRFIGLYPDLPKYTDLLNASIAIDTSLCFPIFERLLEYLKRATSSQKDKRASQGKESHSSGQ